jgi:hypothetical protein
MSGGKKGRGEKETIGEEGKMFKVIITYLGWSKKYGTKSLNYI